MIGTARSFASIRAAALSLGVLVGAAPLASAHTVYPPGWNKPTTPGPVIYEFDPVDLAMHRVPGAPAVAPAYGPVIYQFDPRSTRRHRVP